MRAVSIDPENPLINLAVGLSYVHHALKRQATNRQYLLAQGFAFLMKYHGVRSRSDSVGERQEADFNLARAYHLLGLMHLAMAFYRRILDEGDVVAAGDGVSSSLGREDLVLEAAMNIRTQCLIVGDVNGARAVTERWLVL
jgi:general transcription factor 3C polypeptide 3 (transcription factor C subunit 4)